MSHDRVVKSHMKRFSTVSSGNQPQPGRIEPGQKVAAMPAPACTVSVWVAARCALAYAGAMTVRPADLANTLVRRFAEERTRCEHQALALRHAVDREMSDVLAEGVIRRAWLIGSLAWGSFGPGSDVDVVVEGLAPESSGLLWDRLCGRLGVRVDLLQIENLPEAFRQRVLAEGVGLRGP